MTYSVRNYILCISCNWLFTVSVWLKLVISYTYMLLIIIVKEQYKIGTPYLTPRGAKYFNHS